MANRTNSHTTLSEAQSRRSRAEVVLAEEGRPTGSLDSDQSVRGLLDMVEDGFREFVGEHEMVVVCLLM